MPGGLKDTFAEGDGEVDKDFRLEGNSDSIQEGDAIIIGHLHRLEQQLHETKKRTITEAALL